MFTHVCLSCLCSSHFQSYFSHHLLSLLVLIVSTVAWLWGYFRPQMNFRLFQVTSNPHMFSYLTKPSNYIKENLYAYNFFQCPGSVTFFSYQAYVKISSVKHLPCIFSLVSLLQRLLVISARCATRSFLSTSPLCLWWLSQKWLRIVPINVKEIKQGPGFTSLYHCSEGASARKNNTGIRWIF